MELYLENKNEETLIDEIETPQTNNVYELKQHISMKLSLLERQLYENPRRDCHFLCQQIERKYGVKIEVNECQQLLKRYNIFRKSRYLLLLVLSVLLSFFVIHWFDLTMGQAGVMLALVPLMFNYFAEAMTLFFSLRFKPAELLPPKMHLSTDNPRVSIVIPSRNEPFEVAKMTFDSAVALNYRAEHKQIVVVDNSESNFSEYSLWRDYVESYAKGGARYIAGLEVVFCHRDGVEGFKPRNLDMALSEVNGEFVMYLDIDSTLDRDTLLRAIPQFDMQPKLGFIQLYTLPSNTLVGSALALTQGIKSYLERLQLVFSSHGSYTLFYGHNAIWRTAVVEELGECLEYHNGDVVVAEDLSMTLRAKIKGYHGKGNWIPTGEWVPCSMRETEAMWLRWTVGTMQVFTKHLKDLIQSRQVKMTEAIGWYQHAVLFINGGLMPIFAVLAILLDSIPLMIILLCSYIPQLMSVLLGASRLSLGGMSWLMKLKHMYMTLFVLNSFISWVKCIGLTRYICGKKQGWTPTGKAHEGEVPRIDVLTKHLGMLAYIVCSLGFCWYMTLVDAQVSYLLLFVAAFYPFNLLLSVIYFGRARMEDSVEHAVSVGTVEQYKSFY